MKEGSEEVGAAKRKGVRSETEKHKTKMRERQRRAITTNIFLGLRKHGGYRLSPRADINQVLRHLANEAGWIVDPDGTTYRSSASILNRCSVCGTVRSTTPTSTSSAVAGGGGGENSTPASSCRLPDSVRDYAMAFNDNVIQPATPFYIPGGGGGGGTSSCSSSRNPTGNGNINGDVPLAVYMYGNEDVRCCLSASATVEICGGGGDGGGSKDTAYEAMREARASNQSTPEGSPRLRS
ncbi:Beta-amylase 7 [Cucurbita argyrosperma subsp. argyrosperma]|nr:Beta-amylase 7 [Cucurbita argyrosperma subsp. argyrosperma]